MRTPRPSLRSDVKTLIGNGWLRESPKNQSEHWPRGWDIKSRSALRKCVFLPIPPEAAEFLRNLPPAKPFVPVSPVSGNAAPRPATPAPRRIDPQRNARAFGAVSHEEIAALQRKRLLADARRAAMGKKPLSPASDLRDPAPPAARAWFEDPIAIGTLLIIAPPLGLAALWSSKRYSNDARWALTVMTGLMMFLVAAVVVTLTVFRR